MSVVSLRWLAVLLASPTLWFVSLPVRAQEGPPADLDAVVSRAMETFHVPGMSVAIVKDGRTVVARGYGTRQREVMPKTSSIAVPIRDGTRVLGCLNIIWIDAAMAFDVAARRYLPRLQEAAAEIAARYERCR